MPVTNRKLNRDRLSPQKIDHVSYGTKTMKLSSGQTVSIPNVVRTVIHSRLIQTYISYCLDADFIPLSERTLFRVLEVCAASKRKNLAGLDSFMKAGNDAFVTLEQITRSLEGTGLTESLKDDIKDSKRYLKGDYKTHLEMSNSCSTHCISFALSDGKDKHYSNTCQHTHTDNCDRCSNLDKIFCKLEDNINCLTDRDLKEELQHDLTQSTTQINNWRSHIVRNVNQNRAKVDTISNLQNNQVLLFMDWAMKFIPVIDRESQCEWFVKRGLNWHVTAVCKKEADTDNISVQCYVHLFDSCTQNWFAVASILEHVLKMMKEKDSSINEAFVRSDNAGCYKCAPLLISIPGISLRTEVNIKRYDFSDAQGGKDICDRRIAPIKQHIKAYANEGNNVRTASDMKKAIESYGGIANTFACVALIASDQQTLQKWKCPGVSDLSNFQWSDEGLIAWKKYEMGPGKTFTPTDLQKMALKKEQHSTELTIIEPFLQTCKDLKNARTSSRNKEVKFFCTEINCISSFNTSLELEEHLDVGFHSYILEQESFVSKGWALRQQRTVVRFSPRLRNHLQTIYKHGTDSGIHADPYRVSESLKTSRDGEGKKEFEKEDWISPQQIASFFSRCTYQKNVEKTSLVKVEDTSDDADLEEAITEMNNLDAEKNMVEMRKEILESLKDD